MKQNLHFLLTRILEFSTKKNLNLIVQNIANL